MKIKWKQIVAVIALAALILLLVLKLKSNKEISQNRIYHYDKEKPVLVEVDTLYLRSLGDKTLYSGTFEPNRETKISAELQGKIDEVLVSEGEYVTQGQRLVQLDNSLLKLQQQSIDVQIEGLEADVKRFTVLSESDAIQGVQLEKATLALKSAMVQRANVTEQIKKTSIRAPFNGIITAKLMEKGAFAAPGVPLLQISELETLKFTIYVAENELQNFKMGDDNRLTSDAYSNLMIMGKVSMMGGKSNTGNQFPIQFTVKNNPELAIKAGMFGKVILNQNHLEKGLFIPSSSIVGSADQPQVYLVDGNSVVLQNISVSKKIQNHSLIESGLREGDIIVTKGLINLYSGAIVTIHQLP